MMTLERAREIVTAINDRCMATIGLPAKLASLEGVSLEEMIEAKRLVENANTVNQAAAKFSGGSYSISMVPDDRLIAAVYVLDHYPDSSEPILSVPGRRGHQRVVAVVELAETPETEDVD